MNKETKHDEKRLKKASSLLRKRLAANFDSMLNFGEFVLEKSIDTDGQYVILANIKQHIKGSKVNLELWLDRFANKNARRRCFYIGFWSSSKSAIQHIVRCCILERSDRILTEKDKMDKKAKCSLDKPIEDSKLIREHRSTESHFFGFYELDTGKTGGDPDFERLYAFLESTLRSLPDIEDQIGSLVLDDLLAVEGGVHRISVAMRKRVRRLVEDFVRLRKEQLRLICEKCDFDPRKTIKKWKIEPRTLLDVHHKNPLCEGKRESKLSDLTLLCPNCHRFEHAKLRLSIR